MDFAYYWFHRLSHEVNFYGQLMQFIIKVNIIIVSCLTTVLIQQIYPVSFNPFGVHRYSYRDVLFTKRFKHPFTVLIHTQFIKLVA